MLGCLIGVLGLVLSTYPQMEAPVSAPAIVDVSAACARVSVDSNCGVAYGSAIAISKRRLLTAAHVVEGAERVVITLYNTEDYHKDLVAKVLYVDDKVDLALLETFEDLPLSATVGLGKANNLKLHENVVVLGAPGGESPRFSTFGEFTSRDSRELDGTWMMSAPLAHGMSGGGVFTLDGYLIGISVSGDRSGTCCFFVPAPTISAFLLRAAGQ